MHTRDVCQHWEGASQSNADTPGQKTARLKHEHQCCQTGWVISMSVVAGEHFKQLDGLDGGLHIYTVQNHTSTVCVCVCVWEKEHVKFLAYVPVFILNSTSFGSVTAEYAFLQNRSMDILEEMINISDDSKTQWPSMGLDFGRLHDGHEWRADQTPAAVLGQTVNPSVLWQELARMSDSGCIRDQTCLVCNHHRNKANPYTRVKYLQRILECCIQITWKVYLWNSYTWQTSGM